MPKLVRRIRSFLLLAMLLSSAPASFAPAPVFSSTTATASLTLDIAPLSAPLDSVVTLHISYSGIGLYQTNITVTPNDALSFDPPRSMPCNYNQDPTNCTQFTFRARTAGVITIHASTYGEIYDPDCQCWRFSGASDNAPAILTITGSRLFLPMVHR